MAVKGKGRYWMLLWLAVFLAVALVVVARQKAGLETAGRLARLRETRAALEASRAELERRIKMASSAAALGAKLADQGLAIRQDTAYTYLRVDGGSAARLRR